MVKLWLVVQSVTISVVHLVAFWRMLSRHAAREYLLLEQIRQVRSQLHDCMAKLTFHQYQHQQMLTLLKPVPAPAEPETDDGTESGAERFRDHPTPPGKA